MLFELAYPGLCAAAILRHLTRRPRPVAPLFAFRAVRGRMRRRELALLTALHPRLGAVLALRRFEQASPEPATAPVAACFNNGLAERRFGPEQGARVLLLHGWNADSAMMLPLAKALADQGGARHRAGPSGGGRQPAAGTRFRGEGAHTGRILS